MKKENLKMMKMTDYCSTCHCEGVRKHDCCNPVFRVEKYLDCHGDFQSPRNDRKRKCAFTLAETLITLTILGVVAAITVPMLINKQMEAANRTKVKKAMVNYEKALNQMIIDNDVKGDIAGVLNTVGCTITSPYFKKINGDGCIFQTADKVWWDITDIEHPLISLKDEITDDNIATLKGNADSLDDDKTSFIMVGEIKDGIVRINDKGAVSAEDKDYLDKLYAFINNTKIEDIYANYRSNCTCSMESMLMATQTLQSDDCKSCTAKMTYENMDIEGIFDENGKVVYYNMCPEGSNNNCESVTFNSDGSRERKIGCNSDGNCRGQEKYDTFGRIIEFIDQHDCSNGYSFNDCNIRRTIYMSENSTAGRIINYYDLDGNFKEQRVITSENGKEKYIYDGCNENGVNCSERSEVLSWGDDGTFGSAGGGSCTKAEDSRCKE